MKQKLYHSLLKFAGKRQLKKGSINLLQIDLHKTLLGRIKTGIKPGRVLQECGIRTSCITFNHAGKNYKLINKKILAKKSALLTQLPLKIGNWLKNS